MIFLPLKICNPLILNALFCITIILPAGLLAEKVGKFTHKSNPEFLNGRTIDVPGEMVAMGDLVTATDMSSMFSSGGPSSVFFVIDNSGSMTGFTGIGSSYVSNDLNGARFTVASRVIDLIYQKSPQSQVGLCFFSTKLRFDIVDDPLFKAVGGDRNNGAYLFLMLDSTYNGKKGIDILKDYLKFSMVQGVDSNGMKTYAQVNYKPTLGSLADHTKTNVVLAQQATREAMQLSKFVKEKQFVIFFSDGQGDDASFMTNVQGLPTTFTVFLYANINNDMALQTMTSNIQKNGYSLTNPKTAEWALKAVADNIYNLLLTNVITIIITTKTTYTPKSLNVNGIVCPNPWTNNAFVFGKLFHLTGWDNPFTYTVTYKVTKDSNGVVVNLPDTTTTSKFTAHIRYGAPVNDTIVYRYWGRNLEPIMLHI